MPGASHEGTMILLHARRHPLTGLAACCRYLLPGALCKAAYNSRLFCLYNRHFWLFEQPLHTDL